MNIKYIVISTIIFILSQILIWYQLNSQLVWKWAEGYKSMWWMSLLGIQLVYYCGCVLNGDTLDLEICGLLDLWDLLLQC